jgi:hypothetical protein
MNQNNSPRIIPGMARHPLWLPALVLLLAVVATPRHASAQISRVTVSKPVIGGLTLIGNDVAYDPAHKVYLVVAGYGAIYGVFVNTTGDPVSGVFRIGSADPGGAFGHYPRTEFSPDANNGQGGFLVTWHQNGEVHAVMAAYPSGVISAEQNLGDMTQGGSRGGIGTGLAYSPKYKRFLVTWTSLLWGIQARFVDASGAPTGPVLALVPPGSSQFPAVAWNPSTDEFGLAYAGWGGGGAFVVFQRLRFDGAAAAAPTTFGFSGGTFVTDIVFNPATNRYVMGWSVGAGSFGVQFDAAGTMIGSPALISGRIGSPTAFGLAYNPISGTFLAVSEDMAGTLEAVAAELNTQGTPLSVAMGVTDGAKGGSFVPRVTSRTDAREWNISYSRDYVSATNQIIATASNGGTAPTPPAPPPPPPSPSKPDLTVYNPSLGTWYFLSGASGWTAAGTSVRWGLRGDQPLRGDFDGDKKADLVAYRPSNGVWDVLFSSTNFTTTAAYSWGAPGDIPVPGDYTGDGRTDLAVWRPGNGAWYIYDLARQSFSSYQWGISTDVPVTADFDGDRKSDVAVYRPSTGYWYIVFSSNLSAGAYQWGMSTDRPVPGDYTGDGRADLAVYRPSSGVWYVFDLRVRTWGAYQWGNSSYTPLPADYDLDGVTDLVVWSATTGKWYIYFLGTGAYGGYSLGSAGDIPIR